MTSLTQERAVEILKDSETKTRFISYIEALWNRSSRAEPGRFYEMRLAPNGALFDMCYNRNSPRCRQKDTHKRVKK